MLQVIASEQISMLKECQFKCIDFQAIKEWVVENKRVCSRKYYWDRKGRRDLEHVQSFWIGTFLQVDSLRPVC